MSSDSVTGFTVDEIRVRLGIVEGRSHSLYREFLESPPEGVIYSTEGAVQSSAEPSPTGKRPVASAFRRSSFVRAVADPVFARALPAMDEPPHGLSFKLSKAMFRIAGGKAAQNKDTSVFDIYHSAGTGMLENIPWIIENDLRWVVDLEHVGSLFGYYGDWRKRVYRKSAQKTLGKQLSSRYCRKILPWTDAAKRTIESILPGKEIADKTEVLRLAVRPAPGRKNKPESRDRVRILFVGSANFRGEFWSKGGFEVLESYKLLRERMGDKVELMFRCWMPDEIRKDYSQLPGLHAVTDVLPKDELDDLFWNSDIFLFPAHNSPGMAFLEAMRFGLPVVGKDIWANREIVQDGVIGFLVKPSEKVPYLLPGEVPNWGGDDSFFLDFMKQKDERVVRDLVDALAKLAESESLRKRMGEAGKREVQGGKASTAKRNTQLRQIYEEAARR